MNRILHRIHNLPIGVKAAAVYTFASVFSKGLSIITVPIFTRIMTTEEIGVVNLFNSWHAVLNAVVTLSLTSGGYIAALKEFSDRRDEYQSSVLSLTTLLSFFVMISYVLFPSAWERVTRLPSELIWLMLIGFSLAPAYDFWLARQRYEYKYKLAGALTSLMALAASCCAVIAVVYMNRHGIAGVASGRLIASSGISYIVFAFLWGIILFRGKTIYNKEFWKYSLSLSIPLIGYALSSQVLSVSDRMMISSLVSNSAVGIYSTLYTVSSMSLLVWSAINASFVPYLYQNMDADTKGIKHYSLLLMGSYAVIAVAMTLLAPEIVRILATEEYYEAIYIMPPIAGGVFLTCVSNMYTNILIYYKKTKYIMYAAVLAAMSNVLLNYIFIRQYGYMAAAYTTLFAYVVLAAGQGVCARVVCRKERGYQNPVYNDKLVALLAFATIGLTLSGLVLYEHPFIRYFAVFIGFSVVLCLGFWIGKGWKR